MTRKAGTHRRLWLAGFVVALFFPLGCSSGPRMYKVTGTVTLDGQPLPQGDIVFVPTEPNLGPDAGKIKDGRFEFQAKEGKKKVQISASKIIPGGARGAGREPVPEEYLPDRYHSNTTLTAEVIHDGPNRFEFKLRSSRD